MSNLTIFSDNITQRIICITIIKTHMNFPSLQQIDTLHLPHASNQALADGFLNEFKVAVDGLDEGVNKEFLKSLHNDEENGIRFLNAIFGNSPYLSKSILKDVNFIADIFQWGFTSCWRDIYDALIIDCTSIDQIDDLKKLLRIAKRKVALLTAIADITQRWD